MSSTDHTTHGDMNPDDRHWRAEDMLGVLNTYWSAGAKAKSTPRDLINRYFNALEEQATEDISIRGIRRAASQERDFEIEEELPLDKVPNHEFIQRIGSGGFGEVWLTRQVVTEHYRACKLISASHAVELGGLKWLKQRASSHPNLFPIEEVGTVGSWIYCLMPLAENAHGQYDDHAMQQYESMTFRRLLHRQWRLSNDEVVGIGKEIANGLRCLHERGLTHGDIKPSNILRIDGRWAISDYGLLTADATDIAHGCTPNYTPPEGPGTQAADMYALGVVLMMLVTGNGPCSLDEFKDCSRSNLIRDGINPKWKQVISMLTDPSPNQRPKAFEVDALLDQLGPEGRARGRRKKMALGALCVLGLVAASGTIFVVNGFIQSYKQGQEDELRDWVFSDRFRSVTVAVDQFKGMPVVLDPKISSAKTYSLAISESGQVVAWGTEKQITRHIPKGIVNPVRVSARGSVAMVLQADGRVIQWGSKKKLAIARVPDDAPPAIDIVGLVQNTILILLADGTVRGWGENFDCYSLGKSGVLDIPDDLHDVVRISGYNAHWIVQLSNGEIHGYGCNFSNQIAFGEDHPRVIDFGAGESWSVLLYETGEMESFGMGSHGDLSAPGSWETIDIAVGRYCGIALDPHNRSVQFWGRIGADKMTPNEAYLGEVVSVIAGEDSVGVVHPDGRITMWGGNEGGQCDPPADLRIRLTDPDLDRNGQADWIDKLKAQYAHSSDSDSSSAQPEPSP